MLYFTAWSIYTPSRSEVFIRQPFLCPAGCTRIIYKFNISLWNCFRKILGYVFAGSAMLTLIALSEMPTLLRAFGNRRLLLGLLIVNFTALFMVTHGNQAGQVGGILFYLISNNLIVFTFDIFVEHFSKIKIPVSCVAFILLLSTVRGYLHHYWPACYWLLVGTICSTASVWHLSS